MKVDSTGRARQSAPLRKTGKSRAGGGAAFADLVKEAAPVEAPAAAAPVAGAGPIEALLAIQEVDAIDERGPGTRARQRGVELLDRLEELRLAMLSGGLTTDRLRELATIVAQGRERTDDPGLDQVLEEIELRARVELAKLGY
jgi:hypothetical protein